MRETRKRGIPATEEGRQKLTTAKAAKRNDKDKVWTYLDIAGKAEVDESTVKRFFRGEAVDKESAISICKALGLEVTDIVDPKDLNPPTPTTTPTEINWLEVCGKVLEEQQNNRRLRRKATELGCELNVYVPMGLVERKQQQRRSGDISMEEVYQLTEEEVIVKTYEHDDFLEQAIGQEQNQAGKNKHIAIIGEPGAGKTTLLWNIASWILKNDKGLPICISLGGLEGKKLEVYLRENWLKEALPFIDSEAVRVTPAIGDELIKLFRTGQVWLLLDGVDEMAAISPVEALRRIEDYLIGWLAPARVILTCRLNVWDASNNNTLSGFNTYRTLEFKPDQVKQFIHEWFANAPSQQKTTEQSQLQTQDLGEKLQSKLNEARKERIRELVKNPLRLALLCQIWYNRQVDLPETKAALYRQFTQYSYEWKQAEYDRKHGKSIKAQQGELNKALGKLALAGLNSKVRFRLEESLAHEVMTEDMFNFACDLGWLNLVDRDKETDDAVYAFFHPTFQEYFAAQAIDDWNYFLPRSHDNRNPKPVPESKYRIFEPQWKEVILLWLGRTGDKIKEQKEAFIKALIEFNDGCKDFYHYRAYFLAAAGIAEFKNCKLTKKIMESIIKSAIADSNDKTPEWILNGAKEALRETDRLETIRALTNQLDTIEHKSIRRKVAKILGQISSGNERAIKALTDELETTKENDWLTRMQVAESLAQIDPSNEYALDTLIELLGSTKNNKNIQKLSEMLEKIGTTNKQVIKKTIKKIEENENQTILDRLILLLSKIARGNEQAIDTLTELLQTMDDEEDEELCRKVAESLGQIDPGNEDAIAMLTYFLENAKEDFTRKKMAESLGQIDPGNEEAINELIKLLKGNKSVEIRRQAFHSLAKICSGKDKAIDALINLLQERNEHIRGEVAHKLGQIAIENKQAIDALTKMLKQTKNEEALIEAAESLEQIDPGNNEASKTLKDLLYKSDNIEVLKKVAIRYAQIYPGNKKSIDVLESLLDKKEKVVLEAAHNLAQIDPNNTKAIEALVKLLNTTNNEIKRETVNSLKAISQSNQLQLVVLHLKKYLQEEQVNERISESYSVLWHCAQNMTYPDFYKAWNQDL
ncbi:HEAT repeat domain-containing protein [Aerosakkonemataceae cyanobacterium BLCC-F50]|uniref:HEAT repeat domain-containing protein n=1 Tax=Floridaenema flaviceps BLCC-F50 TaxID=3153642 RepID=A0ABV4XLH9_9CYAN